MRNMLWAWLKSLLKKFVKSTGFFKHLYEDCGTIKMFGQKSSMYSCVKCGIVEWVPIGRKDMLTRGGCTKPTRIPKQ